jgi:aspartate aminotransferase
LPINPEDIISTGGSEALLFAMGSTMDQGDEIIIQNHFMLINGFSTASGVTVVPVYHQLILAFAPIADFGKINQQRRKQS